MEQVIERLLRVVQSVVWEAENRLRGEVPKEDGVLHSRVDGLEAHLTERIDGLGGLEADLVRTLLVEMRGDLDKLKEKYATIAPPLATDALMQLL